MHEASILGFGRTEDRALLMDTVLDIFGCATPRQKKSGPKAYAGWPCKMEGELASPPSEAPVYTLPATTPIHRYVDLDGPWEATYRFVSPRSCAPGTFIRVPVPWLAASVTGSGEKDAPPRSGAHTVEWVTVRVPDDFQPGGDLSFVLPSDFAQVRAQENAAVKLQAVTRGHHTRQVERGDAGRWILRRIYTVHRMRQKKQLAAESDGTSDTGSEGAFDARPSQLVWVEHELISHSEIDEFISADAVLESTEEGGGATARAELEPAADERLRRWLLDEEWEGARAHHHMQRLNQRTLSFKLGARKAQSLVRTLSLPTRATANGSVCQHL